MTYTTENPQTSFAREGRKMRHNGSRSAFATLVSVVVLSMTACNSLLDVSIPGRVPDTAIDDPALAQTMVNAALGEFECAYAQYVATTGVLSGEYLISGTEIDGSREYLISGLTINSNIWGWRGEVEIKGTPGSCTTTSNATGYGFYTPLQTARFLAQDTYTRLEAWTDAQVAGRADKMAQLAAYAGYATTLLGEGFCNMSLDESPLMTRAQVWTKAEDWFTKAITLATTANNTAIKNMALVGRARVRLDLGNTAGADADAALVPSGFVRTAGYSTVEPRRENRVFNADLTARDITVAPAYRGLTVGSPAVADTRVRVVFANRNGQDGVTPQWDQLKYAAKTTPIPVASYTEARLIMAEVEGGAAAINILNALRTSASLPVLTAAEQSNIAATVIEERRRWLFSEGQRYGDMLRLGIPFPTGVNHKNQTYGNVTCVPLPDVETINNPNIS